MQSASKSRPRGVTILYIIGGVVLLFSGTGFIIQGAGLQPLIESELNLELSQGGVMNLASGQALAPGLTIAIGAVFASLAVVSFIVASGLWKTRRWAGTAALVLSITSMAWYAGSDVIVPSHGVRIAGVIISAVTIYYLYRPQVKAYLGKVVR